MVDSTRAAFLTHLIQPVLISLLTLSILVGVGSLLRRWLYRHWKKSENKFFLAFLDSTGIASFLWALAIAIYVPFAMDDLPERADQFATPAIKILVVFGFCLVGANLLARFINAYGRQQNSQYAGIGLSRTLVYIIVLGFGSTVALRVLGVDITPLLATLGVGGIALALALQDTLANFFAGVHIIVESPIYVGDFIKLNTGEEGVVTDIGWRTTRVTMLQNNTIVIPNSKITTSILTNYTMPESRLATDVDIVVAHGTDLDLVRRLVLEEIEQIEGILKQPPPIVLMDPGVLPTHIQLRTWIQIPNRLEQGLLRSELRFRIAARFQKEGIRLPSVNYVFTQPPVTTTTPTNSL